ncbi:hypothetical protein [Sorangium sp. So ce233]|uniref:hypothetical protein n=1 Tax=Sorangium sp. So ce233 TaxID=3133290 RepID=UPI003F61B0C1
MTSLYAVAFLSSLGFSIVIPLLGLLVMRIGGNAFVPAPSALRSGPHSLSVRCRSARSPTGRAEVVQRRDEVAPAALARRGHATGVDVHRTATLHALIDIENLTRAILALDAARRAPLRAAALYEPPLDAVDGPRLATYEDTLQKQGPDAALGSTRRCTMRSRRGQKGRYRPAALASEGLPAEATHGQGPRRTGLEHPQRRRT